MEAADRLEWARTTRLQVRRLSRQFLPRAHASPALVMSFSPSLDTPALGATSAHPCLFSPAHLLTPSPCCPRSLAHYGEHHTHTPRHTYLSAISRFPESSPVESLSEQSAEAKTDGVAGAQVPRRD